MPAYEYKVVPAPTKGLKAKGIKTPEARFSNAIQSLMNQLAGDGWEYQRAETLPSVERSGLASTTTEWRNVLIFRRPREADVEAFTPELLPAPAPVADPSRTEPAPPVKPGNGTVAEKTEKVAEPAVDDSEPKGENGAENSEEVKAISPNLSPLSATRNVEKSTD